MDIEGAARTAMEGQAGARNHQLRALLSRVGVALLINYVEVMIVPGIPKIQSDFATTSSVVAWITLAVPW
jgi:hypothetical protein